MTSQSLRRDISDITPIHNAIPEMTRFPRTIKIHTSTIPGGHPPGHRDEGEHCIAYIIGHFTLSPKLDHNDIVKLFVCGHLKSIMYGYQINEVNHL